MMMWLWFRDRQQRRLQEALAECLQAVAEGASPDECLARYPELAAELGPLLRAATGLRFLARVQPSEEARREALRRFLRAASMRRPQPERQPRRLLAPAALTAAVVVAVAVGVPTAVLRSQGGGQEELTVAALSPAPTPAAQPATPTPAFSPSYTQVVQQVEVLMAQIDEALQKGETIEGNLISELKEKTNEMVQGLDKSAPRPTVARVLEVTSKQREVLPKVQEAASPEVAPEVEATLRLAEAGLNKADSLLTGAASPTPAPTPEATPAQTPSPQPTPTPQPAPTTTPSPTTPAAATPTPSP